MCPVVSSLKLGDTLYLQLCLLVYVGFEIDINLKWFRKRDKITTRVHTSNIRIHTSTFEERTSTYE